MVKGEIVRPDLRIRHEGRILSETYATDPELVGLNIDVDPRLNSDPW